MEPAIRLAGRGACRQCSSAIRRRLAAEQVSRTFLKDASARHARSYSSNHLGARRDITRRIQEYSKRGYSSTSSPKPDDYVDGIPKDSVKLKLSSDNLFHSFSSSPIPEIRRRAAFMRQHAYCPHPDHQHVRVSTIAPQPEEPSKQTGQEAPAHVDFECPDCGIPIYCSKEHWMDDYEAHIGVCDTLKEINEDDHDLRSGRVFPEFNMAETQMEESIVNFTNWDTFLYSRQFEAINDERNMRQATKLLTYPLTIGSVLHELGPYNIREHKRLTVEGLKSFSGAFAAWISY
jgi:mitochondrial splicing suppressor protein 51